MLTAMRGELVVNPELRTVTNPNTNRELKVVDAVLAYQKSPDSGKTNVQIVAWEKAAEQLAEKKKGDMIEFAGHLTYRDYKNETMEKPRKVLGFTVMALDESHTLCQKLEEFMDVQRRPNDKPGAVFQPVRGKIFETPEFSEITDKEGNPLDACRATLRYWNGKKGEGDAFVSLTAYGEAARALRDTTDGSLVQFVGRLDTRPYTNDKMNYSHRELCYNVYAFDTERNLAHETEQFIREQMGLERRPFREVIRDAENRSSAAQAATMDSRPKEVAAPMM